MVYFEFLKKRTNNVGRTFCDAIHLDMGQGRPGSIRLGLRA